MAIGEAIPSGALRIMYWGLVARSPDAIPKPTDPGRRWQLDLARIERFVETHGHSRVPDGFSDEAGRLDVLVRILQERHRSGPTGDGGPYPGIDWVRDLSELKGWEWTER
jgi:hypothetical protein